MYCNTDEAQEKDIKTAFMNIIEVFQSFLKNSLETQTVEGNQQNSSSWK